MRQIFGNEDLERETQLKHVERLIESAQLTELLQNMHRLSLVTSDDVAKMLLDAGLGDVVRSNEDKFGVKPIVVTTPDGKFTVKHGDPAGPNELSTLPTEKFDG